MELRAPVDDERTLRDEILGRRPSEGGSGDAALALRLGVRNLVPAVTPGRRNQRDLKTVLHRRLTPPAAGPASPDAWRTHTRPSRLPPSGAVHRKARRSRWRSSFPQEP